MDRRHFLGAGIAGASVLTFSSVLSQSAPNVGTPTPPAPGFRRMKVGAMEVIAVNDGVLRRPLGDEFVRNAPLEQVKSLLASQNLPTDYVDIPFTPYLVVAGNTKFLIDTGFADNGPPTAGRLKANLAAAGHDIASIDHVIISHFHGDHINGLLNKDGSQVFPKARIHVPAPEMAFWSDDARIATLPQGVQGAAANAKRIFGAYGDRVVRFEPGAELAPGIRSAAAFGHTPGMSVFTVSSEGQSFMYVADVTNVPSLFARSPDWAVTFDMDAEMARQTRRRIFDQLVKDKMAMGGFHFPFPAIGTLEAAGSGYQFKPMA
ncbi:MAG: MBL fold metallo-hydrolase [Hydrogenophaga sp.]|uniref:MBL fold metallo-hydrolase n=1 Tax=Hydrogenophaga crocea TaxID=2716225 RepID=A0A6G8IKY5_9BURK|nr:MULTISPECIES: MBL fold metallo-hydrolase [Hydrogenophaga]MBL0945857.1 MBL fold metallo-hydrolase [Hydrogenophaga sp.]QIM53753.1 MBL fold metallo-hydrolase [Hydrogenophaga crocea]